MPVAAKSSKEASILTSANVHVVNDPTLLTADSVSVSLELFVRLFPATQKDIPEKSSKSHFVLIKFIGVPDYFPKFNIYKISAIDDSAPNSNSVTFINHSNLTKFQNNITFRGCIIQSIDATSIPVLENVIIQVPSAIYAILNLSPADSLKEKFLCNYIASSGCIIAQGDTIRSLNATVSLCQPFHQGLVTSVTNLVLVKMSVDTELVTASSPAQDVEGFELDLSSYLSKSIVFGENEHGTSKEMKLNVMPLPHRIYIPQTPLAAEDSELYAFINTADLSKLGFPVFSGDLVVLHNGDEHVIIKLFTVLEPNSSFVSGCLYLSPLLLLNLKVTDSTKVCLRQYNSTSNTLADAIPIAKSATISRVVSPITMDKTYQQSFFAELKSTFHSQTKCFRKGDFFPVCIDSVLSKALFETSLQNSSEYNEKEDNQDFGIIPTGNPDSVAWFKVVEVSGEESDIIGSQFRIDPFKTALTSSGVEFTNVPKNSFCRWSEYLSLPPLFDFTRAIKNSPSSFSYAREFRQIIETAVHTSLKMDLKTSVLLHSMSRGLGKSTLVRSVALELGLNLIELDAFDFVKPGAELKTIGLLTGKIEKQLSGQLEAASCDVHHILYIKHIESLCAQTDPNEQGANISNSLSHKVISTIQDFLKKYKNLVFVASANDIDKVSDGLRQIVTFEIILTVPSEQERSEIFEFLLNKETEVHNTDGIPEPHKDQIQFTGSFDLSSLPIDMRRDVSSSSLALQSAGLTPRDLISIIRKTKQLSIMRHIEFAKEKGIGVEQLIKIGNGGHLLLIPEDFEKAINEARNQFSDSIGAPRIPNVKWEDIGGLDLVKDEILDTIDMPLKHPELFNNGLKKRSGILFYGPPGTGKTLLAKAIATNFSLNFFSVKGPELLNMYIGESEANVRRVFQKARDAKPCVIFFDELDSVAPKRGNQGDSGGVMDRIVSQLLAELDGMSGGESNGDGVFVVGATNRPDLLDEALLRPGRFDKMLYLGISDTDEKQTKILEALTRKFKLGDDVDLAKIAHKCSFTFTGADFYALCSDSMLNAMTRTANQVDVKLKSFNEQRAAKGKEEVSSRWWFDNIAAAEDINVLVTMEDFYKAQSELVPSVSADELAHYLRVKENFEGGKQQKQTEEKTDTTEVANGFHTHLSSADLADTNTDTHVNGGSKSL